MQISNRRDVLVLYIIFMLLIPITFYTLRLFAIFILSDALFNSFLTNYINKVSVTLANNNYEANFKYYIQSITFVPVYYIEVDDEKSIFGYQRGNKKLVIKRVNAKTNEDLKLTDLNHPNIVHIYNTFRTKHPTKINEQYAWIVMEKLDIDITFEYVKRNKKIITTIIKDISAALKYLHDQKIAHLDVKLENIMGKRVENEVVYKLIDFGYSRIIDNGLVRFKDMSLGTFPYKPPEIVFHNIHSTKADIWALGASVYFLLLNKFICFEKDAFNMQKYVTFLNQNVLLFNENTDNELMNFVISCMINDYRHRPSINEIIIDIT